MHIEGMLQSLYAFFSQNPKVLEIMNLVKTLETKGLKLLQNIKIRWMSMLSPLKHVLGKYKSLVVKMHTNARNNKLAWENLDLLCDIELVFYLPCILPMLEMVHTLIKYVQRRDVFICEFNDVVKANEAKLHQLYVDPFCKCDNSTFNEFTTICEHRSELLALIWVSHEFDADLYLLPYLAFNIVSHNYILHNRGGSNGAYVYVNMSDQFAMIESVKVACLKAATTLCVELFRKFLNLEIMLALGIMYP
jgi:hypothetical protein